MHISQIDFIVTLDRPRVLRLNDRSWEAFRRVSARELADVPVPHCGIDCVRVMAAVFLCLAREADPSVDPAAVVGAINRDSLPRMLEILARISRAVAPPGRN